MEKIKSIETISEHYSEIFRVEPLVENSDKECIKEIREESHQVSPDKIFNVYRGYNYNDELMFEFHPESVNVKYFTSFDKK